MTETLESIEAWFSAAMPHPTARNRSVQVGCLLEEVAELMEALGDHEASDRIAGYATYYKAGRPIGKRPEIEFALADALADIQVTASGVAYLFGIDAPGALAEVARSNWSKFVDGKPVFDANGKIAKGPNYLAPDLREFV